MSSAELNHEWIEKAETDIKAAEFLLGMYPTPIEIICFHCEQAAEKMLKGFLAANDVEPPKTHDLAYLCKLCTEIDTDFDELAEACIGLTPYGVGVRYPSDMEIDESDMEHALEAGRRIFAYIEQRLIPLTSPEMQFPTM